jgi:hypothetical protein
MSIQKEIALNKIKPYAKNPRARTPESLEQVASFNQAVNPRTN